MGGIGVFQDLCYFRRYLSTGGLLFYRSSFNFFNFSCYFLILTRAETAIQQAIKQQQKQQAAIKHARIMGRSNTAKQYPFE